MAYRNLLNRLLLNTTKALLPLWRGGPFFLRAGLSCPQRQDKDEEPLMKNYNLLATVAAGIESVTAQE